MSNTSKGEFFADIIQGNYYTEAGKYAIEKFTAISNKYKKDADGNFRPSQKDAVAMLSALQDLFVDVLNERTELFRCVESLNKAYKMKERALDFLNGNVNRVNCARLNGANYGLTPAQRDASRAASRAAKKGAR